MRRADQPAPGMTAAASETIPASRKARRPFQTPALTRASLADLVRGSTGSLLDGVRPGRSAT